MKQKPTHSTGNNFKGDGTRQQVKLFTHFDTSQKMEADEDGFIYIEGYASTDDLDRHGDIVPADVWSKKALKNFKKNPVVLYNHNHSKVIGKVVDIEKRENGLFVKCAIDALDEIGRKIGQGLLKTFSIGFYLLDFDYNTEAEAWVIKALELLEISVVSIPANQDATFSLAKQLGGENEVKALRQKMQGTSTKKSNMSQDKNTSIWSKIFGTKTEEEATEDLEGLAAKIKDLETENAALKASNIKAESEKTQLQGTIDEFNGKKLDEAVAALGAEKTALETSINKLEADAVESTKNAATLTAEIEDLKAKLAKKSGIKTTVKGGADPVLGGKKKKKFNSPNADAASGNLDFLKKR